MKKNYTKGFVPALGTPLTSKGDFIRDSFVRQIHMMLGAGAVGILVMGSMGIQATIKSNQCRKIAKTAVETVNGKVPVYVGAMDCSVARCKERIEQFEDLEIDGIVLTPPYYNPIDEQKAVKFFTEVAKATKHNIYLYDLPSVTQTKITYNIIKKLLKSVKNITGIKTADINMIRKIMNDPDIPENFKIFFSGLDMFDVSFSYGVCTNLDGMFTCTPVNSKKMYDALKSGDTQTAANCLSNILRLRDFMLTLDLMPAYTAAMNLLGCEGIFHQDYCTPYNEETLKKIKSEMIAIGENV